MRLSRGACIARAELPVCQCCTLMCLAHEGQVPNKTDPTNMLQNSVFAQFQASISSTGWL